MSQEITKLYQELLNTFDESSVIDEEILNKLEEKVIEFKSEELITEWTEIISEFKEKIVEEDAAGNRMANKMTKSTLVKRKRKLRIKLDDLGRVLSRFLPGFECVYETEVTKETREYGDELDEGDEYKPVETN